MLEFINSVAGLIAAIGSFIAAIAALIGAYNNRRVVYRREKADAGKTQLEITWSGISLLFLGLVFGLISGLMFYVRDTGPPVDTNTEGAQLVTVPGLDDLSQTEAEQVLRKRGLIPDLRPQHALGVDPGRVIRNSQQPVAGLFVSPGTHVSFAVSVGDDEGLVTLFKPAAGGTVPCSLGGDGIYRFSVTGTSSGVAPDRHRLLLWVRPVQPSSERPGWYLQRAPTNGIGTIAFDGGWEGVAQLGNAQWPPHEGDRFDVAVSVADVDSANRLMAAPGVVVEMSPEGIAVDTATGLVVTLRQQRL